MSFAVVNPWEGQEPFFWCEKNTSFHPFHSPTVAFTLKSGVSTACFSAAGGTWDSSNCCVSEKTPSISLFILSDAAQPAHFLLELLHLAAQFLRNGAHLAGQQAISLGIGKKPQVPPTAQNLEGCICYPVLSLHQSLCSSRDSCSSTCWRPLCGMSPPSQQYKFS